MSSVCSTYGSIMIILEILTSFFSLVPQMVSRRKIGWAWTLTAVAKTILQVFFASCARQMVASFLDLPPEVHREIWEHLPLKEWITLSLVSKHLHNLTCNEPKWPEVALLFDDGPAPFEWLKNHGKVGPSYAPLATQRVHFECNSRVQCLAIQLQGKFGWQYALFST
jgi:F-box domain